MDKGTVGLVVALLVMLAVLAHGMTRGRGLAAHRRTRRAMRPQAVRRRLHGDARMGHLPARAPHLIPLGSAGSGLVRAARTRRVGG